MAQEYSVGDKVSLLWEDAVFDAAVIKVHSNGAVDVAFKKDGSIGKNLTKAENILQLLGEDWKKKEKPKAVGGEGRERRARLMAAPTGSLRVDFAPNMAGGNLARLKAAPRKHRQEACA